VETDQNTDASILLLEKELKEAVVKQEFEKAAQLRDKIKSLK
jgi:protein-arginine kinase activator protein McsA